MAPPLGGGEAPNDGGRLAAPIRAEEKCARRHIRKGHWRPSAPRCERCLAPTGDWETTPSTSSLPIARARPCLVELCVVRWSGRRGGVRTPPATGRVEPRAVWWTLEGCLFRTVLRHGGALSGVPLAVFPPPVAEVLTTARRGVAFDHDRSESRTRREKSGPGKTRCRLPRLLKHHVSHRRPGRKSHRACIEHASGCIGHRKRHSMCVVGCIRDSIEVQRPMQNNR